MKLAHVDMDRAIDLDCRKAVEWIFSKVYSAFEFAVRGK